jgi:CheY-like chemotaxis protein
MLLDVEPAHAHHERLKAIESIVRSGADLSKQLLGYARGGRYEVKPLNINDVIEKTASMFGRTKKEIEIHQSLLPELWSVEADQVQIEQVLMNLFVNAWQAMPGGGSLYLSSSNVMLDEQYVKAFDTKPGPFVRISVTDTGVGMDEQVKARIFEPFFSTKGMGRGTGIGLASVYGIIRGHKGIIVVYSEKGRGANFNIYLPASEEAAVPLDVGPGVQSVQGHETILLAEDEVMIADVTTQMLKSLGYEVLNASTGEEAAQIYRENRARIDLVIMDMIMPGGGGGPAVDKISEINPEVKVILSSGYSLNGMIKEVMDRGGIRSFIQKPFLINELSAKIREILARNN